MLNAMPRERQTAYLIEKLKPYEAISPGPRRQITSEEPKFTSAWVRLSPASLRKSLGPHVHTERQT